jgi:transcriptional regulator with XRE-family HTH domain
VGHKIKNEVGPLGKLIRQLRKKLHWNQTSLARISGLYIQTVQNLETGRTKSVHNDTRAKLARALKVTEEYFLNPKKYLEAEPVNHIEYTADTAEDTEASIEGFPEDPIEDTGIHTRVPYFVSFSVKKGVLRVHLNLQLFQEALNLLKKQ